MDNFEWLAMTTSCKGQMFTLGSGGLPEVEWTDKVGVIAKLPSDEHKALCCLLAWGSRIETRLNTAVIENALARQMLTTCKSKPRDMPLDVLAQKIARAALFTFLYPWVNGGNAYSEHHKPSYRLWFAGIALEWEAYQKTWEVYERTMIDTLHQWQAEIDSEIGKYRQALNRH